MKKPDECSNCKEKTRLQRAGFITCEGYLCEACNTFHFPNGKTKLVTDIRRNNFGNLVYSQLIFEKTNKYNRKKARQTVLFTI